MQQFYCGTRVYMGQGALSALEMLCSGSVLLVTDSFLMKSGMVETILQHLKNCKVRVFDRVVPDPPMEVISEGVAEFLRCGAEAIVALGGGSSLDTAKAIRSVVAGMRGKEGAPIELYAIPTTSGSGSEVTDIAVITNANEGIKYPLQSAELAPTAALLEPELVKSVPPHVTADTGMDVLTHAIEAYVAKNANDFTDALSEKAAELVFCYLPEAYKDGTNILAREKMHNASCMAGLAFNMAGLGITHGLSHALGARFHVPHGRLNAILLPVVIRFNAGINCACNSHEKKRAAEKYQRLALKLGLSATTPELGALNLASAVERLNRRVGIPGTLRQAGINTAELFVGKDEIVTGALSDATASTNPCALKKADLESILKHFKV